MYETPSHPFDLSSELAGHALLLTSPHRLALLAFSPRFYPTTESLKMLVSGPLSSPTALELDQRRTRSRNDASKWSVRLGVVGR